MSEFLIAVQHILARPEVNNRESFKAEARWQSVCAVGGERTSWHPHHVVYEQQLVRMGLKTWDTRNALRLCVRCHHRHHQRVAVVPTIKLMDENIVYAFVVFGAHAADWLRRYYDDSAADPRIMELEFSDEPLCAELRG